MKNVNDDEWRKDQLLRHLSNSHHPFCRFGTGNSQTLAGEEVRNGIIILRFSNNLAIIEFYETHYDPQLMKLVVYGRQNLEQLSGWVVEMFSLISKHLNSTFKLNSQNENCKIEVYDQQKSYCFSNFGPPSMDLQEKLPRPVSLPLLTHMRPLKRLRELNFYWMVPGQKVYIRSKPLELLAVLIAQESPNSLLSVLKERNWATGLVAEISDHLSDFDLFHLTISLSSAGLRHYKEVIGGVFSFFTFLSKEPLLFYWKETSQIEAMGFEFGDARDPSTMAHETSREMFRYSPEEVLRGPSLMEITDIPNPEALLNNLLTIELVPHLCHIIFLSHEQPGNHDSSNQNGLDHLANKEYELNQEVSDYNMLNTEIDVDESDESTISIDTVDSTEITDSETPLISATNDTTDMETEPWYGTLFRSQTLTEVNTSAFKSAWNESVGDLFKVPKPNLFIASDFSLKNPSARPSSPPSLPRQIAPGLSFKQDDLFLLPKAIIFIFFQISDHISGNESKRYAQNLLLHSLLLDLIDEEFYEAVAAGLEYSFEIKSTGLLLRVAGYSQKLPTLMKSLVDRLFQAPLPGLEGRFEVTREQLLRELGNQALEHPFKQARSLLSLLLTASIPGTDQNIHVLNNLDSFDKLGPFFPYGSSIKVEMFVHGNVGEQGAISLFGSVKEIACNSGLCIYTSVSSNGEDMACLEKLKSAPLHSAIVQLPAGVPVVIGRSDVKDPNNCIHLYFQLGKIGLISINSSAGGEEAHVISKKNGWLAEYATGLLLAQLMGEPFFDQLRTKEQLGYIVRCQGRFDGNVFGIEFVVQSEKSPLFLYERIWEFLNDFYTTKLSSYSNEELTRHKEALIHHLTERPSKLLVESLPYWAAIWRGDYEFNLYQLVANYLEAGSKNLDKGALLKSFKEHILNEATRRLVIVSIFSAKNSNVSNEESDVVVGIDAFKSVLKEPILLTLGQDLDTKAVQDYKVTLSTW